MFKKIILIICLLYSITGFASVNSPQPHCISVLPNGDITLTWSTPADPGGTFNSYHIYTSLAVGGPYTLLDSVFTYTQTAYTHVGANGNTASRYYYIATRYTGGSGQAYSAPIDTIRSIFLNVINPGNGTALLFWNSIATPALVSSTGTYNIYQEYPLGVWTLTGTTKNLNFIDTIFICNDTINYKVEIADATGCTSVSSIDGGKFQNTIVPVTPVLDTLSVDDNNNAQMNWSVNTSPDVEAYVVYKANGLLWIPIDTVYGINNTSFTYLLSNAQLGSEEYRIAAYDTCSKISPMGVSFKTIYLTSSSDICNRSVILNWSAYPALGTGLSGYRIYQSTAGLTGPYALIGSVSSTELIYTATGLAPTTTYYYKVQAFDASGTKTVSSNRISFYSSVPIPPTFSYLRSATVAGPDRIILTCHVDIAASTLKYKIMRSSDGINFTHIGTVLKGTVTPITFTDKKVNTDKFSYYYKVINVDSCGYDGMETNFAKTILLKAISNSYDMTNELTWNDYEGWTSVLSYNIYRGIDGTIDPAPIANVPFAGSADNAYVDDIFGQLQGEGVFNYRIEALEGPGNLYGFVDTSLSNIADAYQEPLVHIPNAFRPGEKINSIFIPVTTYVDFQEYEFSIFDRWGMQLFTTEDVLEGWDGTHKGKICEFGVFVYIL
ncbi:MAG: hypothetical protein ACT4ON_06695, partial [Bacteroidota bacterium]